MNRRQKKKMQKKFIEIHTVDPEQSKKIQARNEFFEKHPFATDVQADMYLLAKEECDKVGMECVFQHDFIYIKTKYERWKFEPTNGKITLHHQNSIVSNKKEYNSYHVQFREWIEIPNLIKYIDEHSRAKFTSEVVHFSQFVDKK